MSRRVATSGSSRCSRTSVAMVRVSASSKPSRMATSAAIGGRRWPRRSSRGRRAGPCRCRAAARRRSSRSGRATSRAYRGAAATAWTRCRSTVYRWIGWCCGRPRSRVHSGSQAPTRPYRSHASQTGSRPAPVPSSVTNAGARRPATGDRAAPASAQRTGRATPACRARSAGRVAGGRGDPQRQGRVGRRARPRSGRARPRRPGRRRRGAIGVARPVGWTASARRATGRPPASASSTAYAIVRASSETRRSRASPSRRSSWLATASRSCARSRSRRRPTARCSASRTSSSRGVAARTGGRQASVMPSVPIAAQDADVTQTAARPP